VRSSIEKWNIHCHLDLITESKNHRFNAGSITVQCLRCNEECSYIQSYICDDDHFVSVVTLNYLDQYLEKFFTKHF